MCVCVYLCVCVCNRLPNQAYNGDKAFTGDSIGLEYGLRLNFNFYNIYLKVLLGKNRHQYQEQQPPSCTSNLLNQINWLNDSSIILTNLICKSFSRVLIKAR